MSVKDETSQGGQKMSPRLELKIPSNHVHVYFVQPSFQDRKGIERTSIYYTDAAGQKFKFMAKNPTVREDLIALGKRSDLASVDEEFTWEKGGTLTIRVVPRHQA